MSDPEPWPGEGLDAGTRAVDRSSLRYRLAFSALVAGLMSVLIGGAISVVRTGLDGALQAWAGTAPIAFVVAFPTSYFVVPIVQGWLDRAFAPAASP